MDDRIGWEEKDYMSEWGLYAAKLMSMSIKLTEYCAHLHSEPEGYDPDDDVVVPRKKRTSNYVEELTDEGDVVIPADDSEGFKSVCDKQAFVRNYFAHNYSKYKRKFTHCFVLILQQEKPLEKTLTR